MPVLEGMACGLAVVTSACGGVSNFIHPNIDCLVAETGDVERECLRLVYGFYIREKIADRGMVNDYLKLISSLPN